MAQNMANPPVMPVSSSPDLDDKSSAKVTIEHHTREIVEALDACEFESPALDRLVPDFKSDREVVEGFSWQPSTSEEYLEKHRVWAAKVPNRTMRVLNIISSFDEVKGKADVWVWLKVTGWGAGHMSSESISCFKWQRSSGVWWCHQHTGMRGVTPMQCSF